MNSLDINFGLKEKLKSTNNQQIKLKRTRVGLPVNPIDASQKFHEKSTDGPSMVHYHVFSDHRNTIDGKALNFTGS